MIRRNLLPYLAIFTASVAAIGGPSLKEARIRGFERQIISQVNKYGCSLWVTSSANPAERGKHGIYLTNCQTPGRDQRIVTSGWDRYPFGKDSPYPADAFTAFEHGFDPVATAVDFSKNPKRRVVQAPRVVGQEVLITPDPLPAREPRFRCQASPGLCDTSFNPGTEGRPLLSPGARGAIASGLGIAAAAFEGLSASFARYEPQFGKGMVVKSELTRVANGLVEDAREVTKTLETDHAQWKELGAPQIEMIEGKESLAAKSMKQEAAEALAAAGEAEQALAATPTPSEAVAERSAVIGSLTENSLLELAAAEIPPESLRPYGTDLGGFLSALRERNFAGPVSPSEREIQRESSKWARVEGHAAESRRAAELLGVASLFAAGAALPEADALFEEARSLRYVATGYSRTMKVAVETERGIELKDAAPGEQVPGSLAAAAENFERGQEALAAKQRAVNVQILAREPGEKLRHRDEAAFSLSSALGKLAGKEFYRGKRPAARASQEMANAMADIALGLTPGVSAAKDFYELVSGRNLVTGEELGTTGRAFAAVGVLTLGLSTEVRTGAELALKAAESVKVLKPVTNALRAAQGLIDSAKAFASSKSFLERLRVAYREGAIKLPDAVEDVQKVIARHPELYERLSKLPGVGMDLDFVRAIDVKFFDKTLGKFVPNSLADVFKWHGGMRWANHRFSIGGSLGREALYTTRVRNEGELAGAVKTALQESNLVDLEHYLDRAQMFGAKVLDLRDPDILKHIGVTAEELTQKFGPKNGYLLPQMIGDIASELGFTHIISTSEKNAAFENIIHLVKPK